MFEEARAMFIYCVSPVHMGAGTALGVIDNPIQRERLTGYPTIAGSGLKGALRHHLAVSWEKDEIWTVFGPDTSDSSEYAGALSLADAHLVAFPVRSAKRAFVYAVSPTTLARASRLLAAAGVQEKQWEVATVQEGSCRVVNRNLLVVDKVALEAFEFTAVEDEGLRDISAWIAKYALPGDPEFKFFKDKLNNDLVLLSDEDFGHFVRNSTVVEPHVRINDASGTAEEGGLFYTENLPPESVLLSLIMASRGRGKGNESADDVMTLFTKGNADKQKHGIDGALVQVGGDATTGRGQVVLTIVGGNSHAKS
jgi:CRISPR-associated protein Cmr4